MVPGTRAHLKTAMPSHGTAPPMRKTVGGVPLITPNHTLGKAGGETAEGAQPLAPLDPVFLLRGLLLRWPSADTREAPI